MKLYLALITCYTLNSCVFFLVSFVKPQYFVIDSCLRRREPISVYTITIRVVLIRLQNVRAVTSGQYEHRSGTSRIILKFLLIFSLLSHRSFFFCLPRARQVHINQINNILTSKLSNVCNWIPFLVNCKYTSSCILT